MNIYDKEEIIISRFQDLGITEIRIYPFSLTILKLFRSVYNRRKWKKWINSSGKNVLPPDFYNEKMKIMMDVMRIDDHAYVNKKGKIVNPHNERESKIIEELINHNENFRKVVESGRLFINPDTGLRGHADHNYHFYINNFKRVVEKHIKKISNYKSNHPGYKTIFFVFDESSFYVKCLNNERPTKPGQIILTQPHLWWKDNNMLNVIKDSDIDYLFWMTPFKHANTVEKIQFPKLIIYDVHKLKFDKFIDYDVNDMESIEV